LSLPNENLEEKCADIEQQDLGFLWIYLTKEVVVYRTKMVI
jgi:hypothetical protein